MKISKRKLKKIIREAIEDINPSTGRRQGREQQYQMYDDLLDIFHKYHFTSEDIEKLVSNIQKMRQDDLEHCVNDAKIGADVYHGVIE